MFKKKSFSRTTLLLVSILLFISLFSTRSFAQAFKRLFVDQPIIDFNLKTLNDQQVSTKDFINKKILIVIFWKNPSLRSPDALIYWQKLYDKYKTEHNFAVISVYCPRTQNGIPKDELDDLQKFIADKNITFPVLLDDGLNVFSKYGVISLPSSMITDISGTVKYILPGFPKFGAEKDILKNLKKILGIPEEKVIAKKYEPSNDASRNYKLAMAVLKRGNTDKAISYLKKASELDPKYPEPFALLGKLYQQKKNNEKALENYQKALELDPENTDSLINYGFLCMDMNLKDDALLQFKNILEIAPDKSGDAYFGMGTIFLKNEVYDSAMTKVKEAIKIYQNSKKISDQEELHLAMSFANLAEIHLKNDNKTEALKYYQKALDQYNKITSELIKEAEKVKRAN